MARRPSAVVAAARSSPGSSPSARWRTGQERRAAARRSRLSSLMGTLRVYPQRSMPPTRRWPVLASRGAERLTSARPANIFTTPMAAASTFDEPAGSDLSTVLSLDNVPVELPVARVGSRVLAGLVDYILL